MNFTKSFKSIHEKEITNWKLLRNRNQNKYELVLQARICFLLIVNYINARCYALKRQGKYCQPNMCSGYYEFEKRMIILQLKFQNYHEKLPWKSFYNAIPTIQSNYLRIYIYIYVCIAARQIEIIILNLWQY